MSAAIVQAPNYFLCICMLLNLFGSCSNVCKNGQSSTCQTPAQVTCAHCQRSSESASAPHPFLSLSVVAEAPDRAAHYRVVFVAVNTLLRFFSRRRTEVAAEKVSHSGGFRLIRQHLPDRFDPRHLKFVKTLSCGPRIIGKYQNPSTPQRINLSFVSARFRCCHSGRAL